MKEEPSWDVDFLHLDLTLAHICYFAILERSRGCNTIDTQMVSDLTSLGQGLTF